VIDPLRLAREQDLLALVEEFLQAAQDPGHWPAALARLVRHLGCEQAMLLRGEGGRRIVLATNHLSPEAIRNLAGRRGDPDDTWPICPPHHKEFVFPGSSRVSLLVDRVSFDAETLTVMHRLTPLLAAAWRLTDMLAASERRQSWRSSTLDPLPTGILVLARDGRLLQSNPAAARLLAEQRELQIEGGRLRGVSPGLHRSLAALLTSEIHPEEKRVATEAILLPRGSGGKLEVLVIASPRFSDAMPSSAAVALLFDPEVDAENPAVALASKYNLSFEQTQVVDHLLHGRNIPETAAALGVPDDVVTALLGGLYTQVGTTRQVELVKLLLGGT
jgi:PAS domain-containing protein